jgi:hypothetical protein
MPTTVLAAGARVEIRSAEWIVRRVDATSTGGYSLLVTGVSEIVRDKEARFLTERIADHTDFCPPSVSLSNPMSGGFGFGWHFGAALYLCRAACQLVTTVRGGEVGASPTGSSTRNWLPSVEGWYVFPLLSGSSIAARNSSWGTLRVSSGLGFTSTAIILRPEPK